MQNYPALKVKPSHYTIRDGGEWLVWPYGEITVTSLKKHELGKPKNIQGLLVFSLYGGLYAANTYWRWDFTNGFTDGVYAHGSTPE